jgi:2'-5' RNA ligase
MTQEIGYDIVGDLQAKRMPETIRAFIALELPEPAISSVLRIQEILKSYRFKMRWVQPENMHLTLKFLGDVNTGIIEKIENAMFKSVQDYGPMRFQVRGMGVFPGVKKPRVAWCGLKGDTPSLLKLHGALEEQLVDIGFSKEKRSFKGHLTMGRAKASISPGKLIEAMKETSDIESESFHLETITLFQSDLQPKGAVYTRLKSISL